MAERKKLTMYYPPDFDPKLVPRRKRDPTFTCEVRMMLPFSVQCDKCGEFMYMGKKFNSKKENAQGEKYKGIQIIRFWIKCSMCSNMMTFKTDPQNDDYAMESGGSRTFEMWQETNAVAAANLKERIDEDKEDAMTALENRTRDTQRMVDMMDALDELKAVSQRNDRIGPEDLLKATGGRRAVVDTPLEDDDEALLKTIKFGGQGLKEDSGEDEAFVLEELEASGKKLKPKEKKREHASSKEASVSSDSGAGVAVALSSSSSASADPASLGVERARGSSSAVDILSRQLQEAQRADEPTLLPTIKRRKLIAKPKASDATAAAVSTVEPAVVKEPAKEAPAGLMGLGEYGSSGDSE
jgi:hypothetical protein